MYIVHSQVSEDTRKQNVALKSYLACSALVQARGTNLDYEVGTIPVVCMYYALCVHECVLVALGTIPLLRQHIFALFLTHPPTIVSINTALNVSIFPKQPIY